MGPFLRNQISRGNITLAQAEAIWSAATTGEKSYSDWLASQK